MERARLMTVGRNKMNISRGQLYKIIVEEYIKETVIEEELSDEKKEELLAWIRGTGPRPEWATAKTGTSGRGAAVQAPGDPSVDRAADTMPFPADGIPPEPEALEDSGPEEPQGSTLVDQITALVQGMSPEDVSDLFQTVFLNIPGVEIGPPEEAPLPTEYGGEEYELRKKQGRTIGIKEDFDLKDLQGLIREVLAENV